MSPLAPTTTFARVRPHLAAAFIVVHVAASLLDALPNPSAGMDRRNWKEPRVQIEMEAWSERLGVEKATLEEGLWQLTTGWMELRTRILAPARPYLDVTGVRQSWSMFVAGSHYRDRFQIRGRACPEGDGRCDWRALYTRGVDGEDFLRDVLEHPRIRSGSFRWMWAGHGKRYQRSCTALARRAFERFPDLEVVQCRFERSLAPPPRPSARPAPPPTWERPISVTRRAAMAGASS